MHILVIGIHAFNLYTVSIFNIWLKALDTKVSHVYNYRLVGVYEALELRDGGSDYLGKGVSKVS